MSEIVEGQDPNAEKQETTVDVDALVNRIEALEQSKDRLLNESKSWKSKYQSVVGKMEEKENQAMTERNDFKGLYEKSQGQIMDLQERAKAEQKKRLETALMYEVARHGRDAEDTEILLAAVKTKKKDVLGYDSDSDAWHGVDTAIDDLRKTNPGLFKSNLPGTPDGRPKAAVPVEKTVDELISEDPNAVLNDALKSLLV